MIDASCIKARPRSAGARGGSQDIARTKGAEPQAALGSGLPRYAGKNGGDRRRVHRLLSDFALGRGVSGRSACWRTEPMTPMNMTNFLCWESLV